MTTTTHAPGTPVRIDLPGDPFHDRSGVVVEWGAPAESGRAVKFEWAIVKEALPYGKAPGHPFVRFYPVTALTPERPISMSGQPRTEPIIVPADDLRAEAAYYRATGRESTAQALEAQIAAGHPDFHYDRNEHGRYEPCFDRAHLDGRR